MPVFDINIANLTQAIYGIRGYQVSIPQGPPASDSLFESSSIPVLYPTSEALSTSVLGTPIFELVKLSYNDQVYTLPFAPLVDVTQGKRIEKTYMTGRKGSVKEYIYTDDFSITIRGILIHQTSYDLQPIAQIEELFAMHKINDALRVESALLNALGIFNLVIESLELPDVERTPSVQPFILNCTSDEPFEIEANA